MHHPVGGRVGAISHSDKDAIYLFGYGTYVGDELMDASATGAVADMKREAIQFWEEIVAAGDLAPDSDPLKVEEMLIALRRNPKIVLDSGQVVWGCECWWGPEDRVKAEIGDRRVVLVDIDKERARLSARI